MKQKILYYFAILLTYLCLFIIEYLALNFIFTIFVSANYALFITMIVLLVIIDPLITRWIVDIYFS
ncbi:MAG: hypothetical protein PUF67_03055 [Firmicutes bacterium]|nr:hypothetical protein [Erysipelotrichaceae bacterium]MDD6525199.1 hypothetical protein [Bacillota bacterium]MDD7227921.1 hypothetical protein [Bacillota bacterium]MDY4972496.1 hypothetical protein [Erysipelotrichaceae bacterium]MDY5998596.1 hypothetical protein [Erysipelotrichaceae bacterium]